MQERAPPASCMDEAPYIAVLARLAAAATAFAILGNHDGHFYQRTSTQPHRGSAIV